MAMVGVASMRGVPALGLPKISSLVGAHFHANLLRFSTVIDQCKQGNSFRLQDTFKPFNCFIHRIVAGLVHDSVFWDWGHRYLLKGYSIGVRRA